MDFAVIHVELRGGPRPALLAIHELLVPLHVDLQLLLTRHELRQVDREAVRVVEEERDLARQLAVAGHAGKVT